MGERRGAFMRGDWLGESAIVARSVAVAETVGILDPDHSDVIVYPTSHSARPPVGLGPCNGAMIAL